MLGQSKAYGLLGDNPAMSAHAAIKCGKSKCPIQILLITTASNYEPRSHNHDKIGLT